MIGGTKARIMSIFKKQQQQKKKKKKKKKQKKLNQELELNQ